MSAETNQSAAGSFSRRRYMQLVGTAAASAAVGSRLSIEPAEAGAWDTITDAGSTVAGGYYLMSGLGVADYMIEDYGVFQDDYQVAEAQMDAAIRTSISMRDGDDRALSLAWNHLENARDVAWIEAQAATIEPMRNGKSEEEVIAAASDAVAEYLSGTVESNVLNHWNAQTTKLEDIIARMEEHEDIDAMISDYELRPGPPYNWAVSLRLFDSVGGDELRLEFEIGEKDIEMLNGETKSVNIVQSISDKWQSVSPLSPLSGDNFEVDDGNVSTTGNPSFVISNTTTEATSQWADLDPSYPTTWSDQTSEENGVAWSEQPTINKWKIILDRVGEIYDDVTANVEQWASEAYGALQAGEVDMTDVVSPTAMASEMSTRYDETGHFAYAAADLAALNLSVDYENMMTFQLSDGSTFQGTLFVDGAFEWSVGETINPSNVDGAIYAAVDSSTYERVLSSGDHYRTEIDGGEVVIYLEPIDQAVYTIETNNDEAVTVEGTEFSQTNPDAQPEIGQGETDWIVDLSGQLEQPMAEVSELGVAFTEDVESDTIKLSEPFKIVEAYDVESGESVDVVSGDGGTENYNTVDASELEEALNQHREYLDDAGAFESDDVGGGVGGGGGIDVDFGGDGLLDWLTDTTFGIPNWAIVATGGGILLVSQR